MYNETKYQLIMGRFKTYYPISEITTDLYTPGKQWMTENNVEYIGAYHKYLTGEVYTKAQWQPERSAILIPYIDQTISNKNLPYFKLKPEIQLARISPTSHTVVVTVTDYTRGTLQRFFIKKRNDNAIIEINKQQYDAWRTDQIDKKLYVAIEIAWYISGPANDLITGILVPGVATRNKKQIQLAANTIPEIATYLTNPLQFYADTEYTVPKDINK
jgi:hypothetical protein